MPLLRAGPPPFQTALAMVGAKPGQQVLVMGDGDVRLAAEIAVVTGLNGRTVVLVADATAAQRAEAAATEAGALIETLAGPSTSIPSPDGLFDIVVLHRAMGAGAGSGADAGRTSDAHAVAREAWRVLRPGGRAIAIEGDARAARGLRLFQSSTPMVPAADVCARFDAAGFRATRTLGESGGASYAEGVKARG